MYEEPFKVFLSHSEKDSDLTGKIERTLDRLHIHTFVYERYPKGGVNRFERIKEMIKEIPFFLVLLTNNGLQSQWVNQEIGYAVGIKKTPIPIIEIDPTTGKRLESHGFVELHDPILFNPKNPRRMMTELVYTLRSWLEESDGWSDSIWLTCKCGYEFDVSLNYSKISKQQILSWKCEKCNKILKISVPDFELLFLK